MHFPAEPLVGEEEEEEIRRDERKKVSQPFSVCSPLADWSQFREGLAQKGIIIEETDEAVEPRVLTDGQAMQKGELVLSFSFFLASLEMPEVMCCVLLYLLEVLEVKRCVLLCTLEAVDFSKFAEGVRGVAGAGGDALCAYLHAGG